jgi:AcrR family transcriptional regulator
MDLTEERVVAERGPRARMRRIMLDAAMRLMQDGLVPSISDVAEEAQVSRATAYRYFPTQSVLIQAAVDEALGPILKWGSSSDDAEERVSELIRFSYPRMDDYQAPLRAALRLALDQWALLRSGKLAAKDAMVRGHRIPLLTSAVAPLRRKLGKVRTERLTQALSLVFGTEAFVVLKDIWGLDRDSAEEVALWTCHALIRCAAEDLAPPVKRRSGVGMRTLAGMRDPPGRNGVSRRRRRAALAGRANRRGGRTPAGAR